MRSLYVVMLLAALLSAPQARSAPPDGPVFVCQNAVCIYNARGRDSDGDGFSDADERLAGTNPNDPKSHPTVLAVVKTWHKGRPGLKGMPLREVFILPETAPDGTAIGRKPVADLPGRKDAMSALGLTNVFLGGRDPGNGLRAVLNLATASKKAPAPMRVGGIDMRLIADDDGLYSVQHSEEGGEVTEWFDKKTGEKVGEDTTVHGADGCTTTQVCDRDGCSMSTLCPKNNSMTNPDADPVLPPSGGAVIVATPEQIEAYNRKRGTNTTFAPRIAPVDTSAPPPMRNMSPIILVNPEDDSVWISTQPTAGVPTNFNQFGGNVNTGRPDGPVRPPRPGRPG